MTFRFVSLKLWGIPLILVFQASENKYIWIPSTHSETCNLPTTVKQCSWCWRFWLPGGAHTGQNCLFSKNHHEAWILGVFLLCYKTFLCFYKVAPVLNRLLRALNGISKFHCHFYGKFFLLVACSCTSLPTAPCWGDEFLEYGGLYLALSLEWTSFIPNPYPESEFTKTDSAKPADGSTCPDVGALPNVSLASPETATKWIVSPLALFIPHITHFSTKQF